MTSYIVGYAVVGGIAQFFLRKFPLTAIVFDKMKLSKLYECDLCLGFWIYLALMIWMKPNVLDAWGYFPLLSEVITAAFTSFVVWLFRIGWGDVFSVVEVNVNV